MNPKSTKIAVTAASGKLGGEIVKAARTLVGSDNVVGLARTPAKAASLGVEIRPGDYTDAAQLETSLEGIGAVLLVSGMDAPDERIGQHRNVINAAKAAGVKRIVYTSIQGADTGTAFSPIVASNRQTEADVRESGLAWSIGRNGIYIEPDVEYLETYKAQGQIVNCAADGRCGYTTRPELAFAYARMLTDPKHEGQTYNLHGEPLTQQQLTEHLNATFGTDLEYVPMTVEDYRKERVGELGDFLGTVIAGIYEGIRNGVSDNESQYERAAGRPHQSWADFFAAVKRAH